MFSADFHLHTTASDGALPPTEAVRRAKSAGLRMMAITDHDTTNGIDEGLKAAQECGITLIPGVELSAGENGETHVLGFGKGYQNVDLHRYFTDMRSRRVRRNEKIVRKLCELSMPLTMDDVMRFASGTVGRPHIAAAMIEKGYVSSKQEAFEKWLANGCPAYVPKEVTTVTQAIDILKNAGMIPVIAHPSLMHIDENTLCALLTEWKTRGLVGLEVYHPANGRENGFAYYERLAKRFGLIVTGGSDFHSDEDPSAAIGITANAWGERCESDAQVLLNLSMG